MPVPIKILPFSRNRLSTRVFSRKISRTVPSAVIRYSEFSPPAGPDPAEAGVDRSEESPVLGEEPDEGDALVSSVDVFAFSLELETETALPPPLEDGGFREPPSELLAKLRRRVGELVPA